MTQHDPLYDRDRQERYEDAGSAAMPTRADLWQAWLYDGTLTLDQWAAAMNYHYPLDPEPRPMTPFDDTHLVRARELLAELDALEARREAKRSFAPRQDSGDA